MTRLAYLPYLLPYHLLLPPPSSLARQQQGKKQQLIFEQGAPSMARGGGVALVRGGDTDWRRGGASARDVRRGEPRERVRLVREGFDLALCPGPLDQFSLDAACSWTRGQRKPKILPVESATRVSARPSATSASSSPLPLPHPFLFLTPSSSSPFPSSYAGQFQEKQEQQLNFVKGATGMTRAERDPWPVVARRRRVYLLHSAR
jgi:hypothetical protein